MTESTVSNELPGDEPSRAGMGRRAFAQGAVGLAAVGIAAGLTGWSAARHYDESEQPPQEFTRHVKAKRVSEAVPRDPASPAWKSIQGMPISLEPQRMIEPRLERDSPLTLVELRTMHNGKEIGFHVTWEDSNRSDMEVSGQFRDSVAIQLPVTPEGPAFAVMGQPGRPVHLLHWRASWQRAMEASTGTIRDAFPNAVSDLSPEDVMSPELAKRYYPAQAAGNAMAVRKRTSPVEELVAEGFGTITSHSDQRAEGKGVFANNRWEVVMVVPLAGKDNQASLKPGDHTSVAVAVWNGGKGDRGARKQFAYWSGLELEA